MIVLQWILALLLGAVLLAALARRIGVPSPALLALGGVAVAFLPNGPRLSLDPELALALFVAPVLLDAAFDSSLRDLQDNWFPVTCLIVIAVSVTTAAVALVARWLVPAMPWAVAVALGAVVAPPDAAAATAVLKEVRLPHRLLVILEGESLLNDASALLIYRLAVGATVVHAGATLGVASTLSLVFVCLRRQRRDGRSVCLRV
jgi:monovalent cation/hydrogen antiporter